MLKLALAVVAIAIPDCINPSLIGGELLVATGGEPPRRAAVFTAAAWAVTFVFGVLFAVGLGDLILSLLPKPGPTVKYTLVSAAGSVLILAGAVIWLRRASLESSDRVPDPDRAFGSPALVGGGIAGFELLSAFPYFAAIALIVGSGVSQPGKLSLIALYCTVYTLPLIAIAVLLAVMQERAETILRPAGDWLLGHWPAVVAPLTAAIGVAVLAFGVVQLATG